MNTLELLDIIGSGETSTVQFKETIDSKDNFVSEMIAMSNTNGGVIIVGVADKTGEIIGLDYEKIQEYGNRISSWASDAIKPQIFVLTQVVSVEDKKVLIVNVKEGLTKPYKDNNGCIWVKQGGDKRKLTDNNEIIRLFQQSGVVYIDEIIVPNTSNDNVNKEKISNYLEKIGDTEDVIIDETLLKNLNVIKDGMVTLGGLLFFSDNPQRFRPAFCVKAISYFGNDIESSEYRSSVDITGTIPEMFQKSMDFFNSNLRHIQNDQNFNSTGVLEVSAVALEELLQNALTHRDYSKNAPVRIFVFDNRIEIISPGALPNSLTVENIKMGNTVVRNNLIMTFASKLMKYRGVGSGVRRSIKEQPDVEFVNDKDGEQFIVRIPRKCF